MGQHRRPTSRLTRGRRTGLLGVTVALAISLLPAAPAEAAGPYVGARFFGMADKQPAGDGPRGFPRAPLGTIRLWDSGVSWREIEVGKGVYDFARLDAIVATARAHGATPLLVLGQTPRFHATHPGWTGSYGSGAPSMPDVSAFQRYIATVAQRYGTRVDYQVWNEPNVVGYWRGSPWQMAVLTRAASRVVRKFAPGATLVGPSFPVRLTSQRAWMARYYAQRVDGRRVASYVDAVSLNLYPTANGTPETSMSLLRSARAIFRQYGVGKPIWNTEINYGLTGRGTNAANIAQRREAAYVVRTYMLNAASWVRRVYWYSWDLQGLGNTNMTYRDDTTLAPGGVAFKVVQGWLKSARVRGCSVSGAGTYTCTVAYPGGVRRIYWNPSRRTTVHAVGSATRMQYQLGPTRRLHGGERINVDYAPVMVRSAR